MAHGSDDSGSLSVSLPDEAATLALGAALVVPCAVIYLCGPLGAGKTTLARGILRAMGHGGTVKSPTYTLVETYPLARVNFYHFDFYRLNQPEEFVDAGLDEYFVGDGVRLVEWPDKAAPYVPAADLQIDLALEGAGRIAVLRAIGARGSECLTRLKANLATG